MTSKHVTLVRLIQAAANSVDSQPGVTRALQLALPHLNSSLQTRGFLHLCYWSIDRGFAHTSSCKGNTGSHASSSSTSGGGGSSSSSRGGSDLGSRCGRQCGRPGARQLAPHAGAPHAGAPHGAASPVAPQHARSAACHTHASRATNPLTGRQTHTEWTETGKGSRQGLASSGVYTASGQQHRCMCSSAAAAPSPQAQTMPLPDHGPGASGTWTVLQAFDPAAAEAAAAQQQPAVAGSQASDGDDALGEHVFDDFDQASAAASQAVEAMLVDSGEWQQRLYPLYVQHLGVPPPARVFRSAVVCRSQRQFLAISCRLQALVRLLGRDLARRLLVNAPGVLHMPLGAVYSQLDQLGSLVRRPPGKKQPQGGRLQKLLRTLEAAHLDPVAVAAAAAAAGPGGQAAQVAAADADIQQAAYDEFPLALAGEGDGALPVVPVFELPLLNAKQLLGLHVALKTPKVLLTNVRPEAADPKVAAYASALGVEEILVRLMLFHAPSLLEYTPAALARKRRTLLDALHTLGMPQTQPAAQPAARVAPAAPLLRVGLGSRRAPAGKRPPSLDHVSVAASRQWWREAVAAEAARVAGLSPEDFVTEMIASTPLLLSSFSGPTLRTRAEALAAVCGPHQGLMSALHELGPRPLASLLKFLTPARLMRLRYLGEAHGGQLPVTSPEAWDTHIKRITRHLQQQQQQQQQQVAPGGAAAALAAGAGAVAPSSEAFSGGRGAGAGGSSAPRLNDHEYDGGEGGEGDGDSDEFEGEDDHVFGFGGMEPWEAAAAAEDGGGSGVVLAGATAASGRGGSGLDGLFGDDDVEQDALTASGDGAVAGAFVSGGGSSSMFDGGDGDAHLIHHGDSGDLGGVDGGGFLSFDSHTSGLLDDGASGGTDDGHSGADSSGGAAPSPWGHLSDSGHSDNEENDNDNNSRGGEGSGGEALAPSQVSARAAAAARYTAAAAAYASAMEQNDMEGMRAQHRLSRLASTFAKWAHPSNRQHLLSTLAGQRDRSFSARFPDYPEWLAAAGGQPSRWEHVTDGRGAAAAVAGGSSNSSKETKRPEKEKQ